MERRVLIVWDGAGWYARRVRCIEHALDVDEKVYRCDAHLGGPFDTADEAVAALRESGLLPFKHAREAMKLDTKT